MTERACILVVDDEEDNRIILENFLQDARYAVQVATHGEQAWEMMTGNPGTYALVLLDWMMPGTSGLEILQRMQKHWELRHIQVIMQTARARAEEIQQGIDAGAWYYLTKPFDEETLLAILRTALTDRQTHMEMRESIRQPMAADQLMSNRLVIRTLQEAKNLAVLLAKICHDPERRGLGFLEILLNAIEHGNLGVGYGEKSALMARGRWLEEINRRLQLPEYQSKVVEVTVERLQAVTRVVVKDQGKGFDWQKYLQFDPKRATHTHGRGIAMANLISFDALEYRGCGNEVCITVKRGR
ncbi:MAG: response regulator [Magnetococcus sp. YQC-3]